MKKILKMSFFTFLTLALASGLFFTKVNISKAEGEFNVLFTANRSSSVDVTEIYWSTSKEAKCLVNYSKYPNAASGLTEEGIFTPQPNSVNGGRYHFVAILEKLDRNQVYYFTISCSSLRETNVNAVEGPLSFLSSEGFLDRPDLAVTDIYFNPQPTKGTLYNGSLNIVIKNVGKKDTESLNGIPVRVSAINGNTGGIHPLICDKCDKYSSGMLFTNNLLAGETRTVTFNLVNTPFNFGTFNVRADIDRNTNTSSGEITETEEGNNLYNKYFNIEAVSVTSACPSMSSVQPTCFNGQVAMREYSDSNGCPGPLMCVNRTETATTTQMCPQEIPPLCSANQVLQREPARSNGCPEILMCVNKTTTTTQTNTNNTDVTSLLKLIEELKKQIAALQGQAVGENLPNETTTFSYNWQNALYVGMRNNEDVRALQNALLLEKVYTGPVTGNFGPLTLAATKAFQEKYGITPVTGFVGELTRAKLNSLY